MLFGLFKNHQESGGGGKTVDKKELSEIVGNKRTSDLDYTEGFWMHLAPEDTAHLDAFATQELKNKFASLKEKYPEEIKALVGKTPEEIKNVLQSLDVQ